MATVNGKETSAQAQPETPVRSSGNTRQGYLWESQESCREKEWKNGKEQNSRFVFIIFFKDFNLSMMIPTLLVWYMFL